MRKIAFYFYIFTISGVVYSFVHIQVSVRHHFLSVYIISLNISYSVGMLTIHSSEGEKNKTQPHFFERHFSWV